MSAQIVCYEIFKSHFNQEARDWHDYPEVDSENLQMLIDHFIETAINIDVIHPDNPKKIKIKYGEDIDLKFHGKLRIEPVNQPEVINSYLEAIEFKIYGNNQSTGKESGKLHLCAVYYSILNSFGQRSQYISVKFPLHKQSENP